MSKSGDHQKAVSRYYDVPWNNVVVVVVAGRRLADRSRITKRRHPSWADTKSDYKIKNPSNPPPPSLHSLTPHPIFQSDKCHFCCCSILNFFITRFLIPPRQRTSGNNSDNQLIIPAIQSFSRLLVVE